MPTDPSPRRSFVIRDPVHGYLTVAAHERFVVDHPITQRLRRITQTGLAELVFPEARTSRFVHSLGAMHLASRFILACIENADAHVRQEFFEEIKASINLTITPLEKLDPLLELQGTLSALSSTRACFSEANENVRTEYRRLLVLVESGLRFAALFHDLGHLPFSHDGEFALRDYTFREAAKGSTLKPGLVAIASGKMPPHEEIGHRLADLAILDLVPAGDLATRMAFDMGLKILNVQPPAYHNQEHPKASALAWLHSIVDGEIDVDRADYLLRDGQALGLDFAGYDVDRLISNLMVVKDASLGFITVVKEQGLNALESFCLSRSRSTEVFVHHHKVAQIAAALRYASSHVYKAPQGEKLLKFLTDLGESQPHTTIQRKEMLTEFAAFDDPWWFEALRSLRRDVTSDPLLTACLDLVLDRSRSLWSIWKRQGDLSVDEVKTINEGVDSSFSTNEVINLAKFHKDLLEKGILVVPFRFKPFLRRPSQQVAVGQKTVPGDSVMMVNTKTRGLQPANRVSSRIDSLQQAWDSEVHLYACSSKADIAEGKAEVLKIVHAALS
jgi:HD superfamily phosphohydrolase